MSIEEVHLAELSPEQSIPVVDGTGQVVGSAHRNPDGTFGIDGPIETTVVEETSGGVPVGAGGGFGSSTDTQAPGTFEPAAASESIPVVDRTGQVVGSAHQNPDGTFEIDSPIETTVVEETSSGTQPSAGGGLGSATESQVPGTSEPTSPDAEEESIPGFINPDAFNFRKTSDNWQETGCVPIIFGGATLLGIQRFFVGVQVGAPMRLRDGRPLTVREAQLDSANAAQATAMLMQAALNSGTMNPSEIIAKFASAMDGVLRPLGIGYRATRCNPLP